MSRPHKQPVANNSGTRWFENLLVCVVLGLTVLRLTIIETPLVENLAGGLQLSSENISLLLSTCVLLCALLWLFAGVLTGRLRWRRTWFGPAVGLFIVAGVIAACFASNKRAAVTDLTLLAAPMVTAMMLVQWLRSASLIRLALLLVISAGVAATVQCIDQKTDSNDSVITEYENNPAEFLKKQGIEFGSMEHWMYEHRVYSKDIRGFLLTGNSTATFFLMAFFAGTGLWLQTLNKKMSQCQYVSFFCYVLASGVLLVGLLLTRSKGGIGAFVLASGLLMLLLLFGKTIWKYRRLLGVLLLLLVVVSAGFVIHYGMGQGRLPGGNSMLVRWQYWVATTEMIHDHFLTGVGGGNFPELYMHYKIPAALETVQNPHNWVLSLLSQYGSLGLIAFVAAVLVVFFRGLKHVFAPEIVVAADSQRTTGRLWIGFLLVSAGLLMFVRPVLVDADFLYQNADVRAAAYLVLYLVPAAVFTLAFILLRSATETEAASLTNGSRLSIALMCGLIAVLVHNLVDFAIFEPGNWSLFWLIAAMIVAQIHNTNNRTNGEAMMELSKRLGLGAGLVLFSIAYLAVVLLPPLRAELLFRRAVTAGTRGIELTEQAVAADTLSAKIAYQAANMLTQVYQSRGVKDEAFVDRTIRFIDIAIGRNPADFKPWRLRAKLHVIRSEQTEGDVKKAALQKAFEDLQQAVARYPGSGKLHYLLANVAEQLGRAEVALSHYQTAVDIEDAYRAQFKIMYPDRETVISRLGETAYTEAKAQIEALQGNTP